MRSEVYLVRPYSKKLVVESIINCKQTQHINGAQNVEKSHIRCPAGLKRGIPAIKVCERVGRRKGVSNS